jgi:integrase
MSVFRRGKVWHYDFVMQGVRYRGSTNLLKKTLAKEAVGKLKQSIRENGAGIIRHKPAPMLKDFVPEFLKEIQNIHGDDARHKTCLFYQTNSRRLLEFSAMSHSTLDQIDEAMINDYVSWRLNDGRIDQRKCRAKTEGSRPRKAESTAVSTATINREIQTVRRLLRLAMKRKLINRLPQFQLLKEDSGRERVVSYDEERRYLSAAEQPLKDIATIIVDCGLRPDECFRIRREDVNFATGTIFIPRGKTKYARRHVPMTQRVNAIMELRVEGKAQPDWLFPAGTKSGHVATVDSWHQKALKNAEITDHFVLYSLRHTYGTRLGETRAEAFTIQKLMGHSSITMTQRYVHPSPERVASAVTALEDRNKAEMENLEKAEIDNLGKTAENSPQIPPQYIN